MEEIVMRRLAIKSFHIEEVEMGSTVALKGKKLLLNKNRVQELIDADDLITDIKLEVIEPKAKNPAEYDREINTIMDIIPISTKVLGTLGEGLTHTLTGVYVMLTGVDEDGRQMHEFGSSEGRLAEQMVLGKCGTPSENDYIIHMDVTIKGGLPYDRHLPNACFKACDDFIQDIRAILKREDGRHASESHEFFDKVRPGGKKVVIVKQIAGQGAMYDNQLFSDEPSGFEGGTSIIDMCNMPMILSPNEYRDGALRALV